MHVKALEGVGGGGLVFFCFLHFAFLPLARGAAAFIPAEEEEEEDTRAWWCWMESPEGDGAT